MRLRICPRHAGLSILEVLIALIVVVTLLAITIPSLFTAREASYRAVCMTNQRIIGQAWTQYVDDYGSFPEVAYDPAWRWGGNIPVTVGNRPSLDSLRPLNFYIRGAGSSDAAHLFCCPADRGIVGELGTGTGDRTACQAFGTSYRANAWLLDASLTDIDNVKRPLKRHEVITSPSRMVVMGDAFWYEALEQTGRDANWHGTLNTGNLLFLDGSVHTRPVLPKGQLGQAVFDPRDVRAAALPPIAPEDVRRDDDSE